VARVLVVEDEGHLAAGIKFNLEEEGYGVDVLADGIEAADRLTGEDGYDLVILDVMLPDRDGVELCRNLRHRKVTAYILMLTALSNTSSKVAGLDAGADDYLTKPFAMEELLARARAAFRRTGTHREVAEPIRRFGDLEIDLARHVVRRAGERILLTRREHDLLAAFVVRPGTLLTHRQLLEQVWGKGRRADVDSLRHAVRSLRVKLGDTAAAPELITTEPGLGYRWIGEASA